jgi:hypothetical protein
VFDGLVVVAEVIEFGLGVEQFEPDVAVAQDDVAGVDETVVVLHAVVEMEEDMVVVIVQDNPVDDDHEEVSIVVPVVVAVVVHVVVEELGTPNEFVAVQRLMKSYVVVVVDKTYAVVVEAMVVEFDMDPMVVEGAVMFVVEDDNVVDDDVVDVADADHVDIAVVDFAEVFVMGYDEEAVALMLDVIVEVADDVAFVE